MTSKEKLFRAINHKSGPVPWVEIRVDNGIAAGVTGSALDCVNDVRDWMEMAARVGMDCANVRALSRFGIVEKPHEGAAYAEIIPCLRNWEDLERIGHPMPDQSAVLAKIARLHACPAYQEFAAIGVALGCVDPTVLSMGFENCCFQLHDDPKLVEAVLDLYTDYSEALVEIYSAAPDIDVVWITDDCAFDSGPYFGSSVFRELILPRYRRIASRIMKPWMLHSDGDLRLVLPDLLSLGMSVLHPVQPGAMDIFELKKQVGDRVCLAGNLDLDLLANGTPARVRAEVFRLAQNLACKGGYMLSSSNSIPDWIQPDNFLAMGEALRAFNATRD